MFDKLVMISDKEFHVRVLADVGTLMAQRDYSTAWNMLEKVINNVSAGKKAHCFLLRGEIKDAYGDSEAARQEWLDGISFSVPGSFGRLTLEYELGRSYEREGKIADALNFYRLGIKTCADGEGFSGGQPLIAYLNLNRGQIPPDDHDILAKAIQKSWRVLEVPGEPSLNDLPAAITRLAEHMKDLIRQASESH